MNTLPNNDEKTLPKTSDIKLDKTGSKTVHHIADFEYKQKENVFKRLWGWATKDKSRIGSLIFLFLFMVLIIILAIFNQNIGVWLGNIIDWFEGKIGLWGIFIGIFVISIFANFTVIFPVPYTFALVAVAIRPDVDALDILIMGLFAGGGSAIGETSAWLLGRASKNVLQESMEKQVSQANRWIEKGLAFWIVLLFAATPLPDDAILIFIGLLGYALWKTLISCFIGKVILTTATGYAAKYLVETTLGQKLLWLFGMSYEGGEIQTESNIWISAITWIATILIIGSVLFVDWGNLWNFLSRSMYKKKIIALLSAEEIEAEKKYLSQINEEENPNKDKKHLLARDLSFWQCAVSRNEDEKMPYYYDFYTVDYIVEKSVDFTVDSKWFAKFTQICNEQQIQETNIYKLKKLVLPKKLKNLYEETDQVREFTSNFVFIEFKAKYLEAKKPYRFSFLLEQKEDHYKIRLLGEREALSIKQIKVVSQERVISKLVDLLRDLPENPEKIESLSVAYFDPNAYDEEIIEV